MHEHPGGTFSIQHNIGRDVSKFFYGGYSLENIDKVEVHRHSIQARKIVNNLIFGRLSEKARERTMKVEQIENNGISQCSKGDIATLRFCETSPDSFEKIENTELQPIMSNQRCSLEDISMIAKHYTVKSTEHPQGYNDGGMGIKRHYTEAFCLRSDIYKNLLMLM